MSNPLYRKPLPAILDREITTPDADAFGHRHYATALRHLICECEPPYSIGLLGPWGVGKSSISRLCQQELAQHEKGAVKVITFNAWRFGQDIKRALFRHVFVELNGNEDALNERLWKTVSQTVEQSKKFGARLKEFLKRFAWFVVQAGLLILFILGMVRLFSWLSLIDLASTDQQFVSLLSVLAAIIVTAAFNNKGILVSGFDTFVKVEAPSTSSEQFEAALRDRIKGYRQENKITDRLVIFVDDLDRLSAEEMVNGLDGIRAFLEMPTDEGEKQLGVVFVISCDESRVAQALRARDGTSGAELPGAIITTPDARRYLDRIFQFRMEVPPAPRRDMHTYALSLLHQMGESLTKSVMDTGKALDDVVAHMIHPGVQSPRNAVQIVNAFAQSWWLAVVREAEHTTSNRAGALHRGTVTANPIMLAVISTIRVDFPTFFDDLVAQPSFFEHFKSTFVKGDEPKDIPEDCVIRLQKYCEFRDSKAADDQKGLGPISEEYRALRAYISQIQSVRPPDDLAPLLLLTQDPITRGLGDQGFKIYEGLYQQDVTAILDAFGHAHDTNDLTREASDLVLLTYSRVREGEIDLRSNNAAVALSKLAPRLHESCKRRAVTHAVRDIARHPDLRWQVGITELSRLIQQAEPEDRKDVVEGITKALCRPEGTIGAKTEDLETPTLDDAVAMVRECVEMTLDTWQAVGLQKKTELRVVDWLKSRHVQVGGNSTDLGFEHLHAWASTYERVMLESVAQFYVDQAVSEIENDALPDDLFDDVFSRVSKLTESGWGKSQEQDTIQWDLVTRLAQAPSPKAVKLAVQQACANSPDASGEKWSAFVTGTFERLANDKVHQIASDDVYDYVKTVLLKTDAHAESLSSDSLERIESAMRTWSSSDDTFALAILLENRLLDWDYELADTIALEWVPRLTTDLPKEGIRLLGERFDSFEENVQQAILQQVHDQFKQPPLDQKTAMGLRRLLDAGSKIPGNNAPWRKTITHVRSQIVANAGDAGWLQAVSEIASRIVSLLPATEGGSFLRDLVNKMQDNPSARLSFFAEMAGRWPLDDESQAHFDANLVLASIKRTCEQSGDVDKAFLIARVGTDLCRVATVSAEAVDEFVATVVHILGHEPTKCIEVLDEVKAVPSVASITSVPVSPEDEERATKFETWWHWCAKRLEADSHVAVARQLLEQPSEGKTEDPEWKLRLWLDCVDRVSSDPSRRILRSLQTDESLNDPQIQRVLLLHVDLLLAASSDLEDDSELTDLLVRVLNSNDTALIRRFDEVRSKIVTLSRMTETRTLAVSEAVRTAFKADITVEGSNCALQMIKELGHNKEIVGYAKSLPKDKVAMLSDVIPGHKGLKKLKKELLNKDA